jgi:hypothetical protein
MERENRKYRRRPENHPVNLIGARTTYGLGRIVDLSPAGAGLRVVDPRRVPDRFTMVLSYTPRITRDCAVVWKDGSAMGVKFLSNTRLVTLESLAERDADGREK